MTNIKVGSVWKFKDHAKLSEESKALRFTVSHVNESFVTIKDDPIDVMPWYVAIFVKTMEHVRDSEQSDIAKEIEDYLSESVLCEIFDDGAHCVDCLNCDKQREPHGEVTRACTVHDNGEWRNCPAISSAMEEL